MTDGADLDRLAELVGIEPFYHDIWGNRREIGPATKRDLVQAMGFPAGTPEEAADSLYRLRERQWRRMLTPVFVLGDGDSPQIDFTVPAQHDPAGITWTLSEEEGDVHWGEHPFPNCRQSMKRCSTMSATPDTSWRCRLVCSRLPPAGDPVERRRRCRPRGCRNADIGPQPLPHTDEMVEGGGQTWGVGVQLYALRSPNNWGIGDYTDAGAVAEQAAKLGAGVLGLEPPARHVPGGPEPQQPLFARQPGLPQYPLHRCRRLAGA